MAAPEVARLVWHGNGEEGRVQERRTARLAGRGEVQHRRGAAGREVGKTRVGAQMLLHQEIVVARESGGACRIGTVDGETIASAQAVAWPHEKRSRRHAGQV